MAVYVIVGSEDGVISVQGSYRKAYEACMMYIYHTVTVSNAPSFINFKASLKTYNTATICKPSNFTVECEAMRMDVD